MNLSSYSSSSKVNPSNTKISDFDDKQISRSGVDKSSTTKGRKGLMLYIIFTILFAIAVGAAVFFYLKYNQVTSNPTTVLDEQSKSIKDAVGKLILLDNPDEITVKIISDADSVKKDNPEFFKNAKNGHYVLISSSRAILYDKNKNQILNVAPIIQNPDAQNGTSPITSTPAPTQAVTETVKPTITPKR
jgi:hypothetical protein